MDCKFMLVWLSSLYKNTFKPRVVGNSNNNNNNKPLENLVVVNIHLEPENLPSKSREEIIKELSR